MWFLIVLICIALSFAAFALVRARRLRLRDRRKILGEMADLVRLLADPVAAREIAFSSPLRSDEDRAHDTMFNVRYGERRLSLILDTSRMRLRWWVLYELHQPKTGVRTLRVEATFVGNAIPVASIQSLLKAARGELPSAPELSVPASDAESAAARHVDPLESPVSDTTAPAQA
ncbi:MAG: hypothetical protein AAB554_01800 [Patescibacteria group bacterium]